MLVALAQINSTVGDLSGNAAKIREFSRRAAERGAQAVAFPELALNGYPPRDLVEKPTFIERTRDQLESLAADTAGLGVSVIVGYVAAAPENDAGKRVSNSAAVLENGRVAFRQDKMLLPTYDVFDEARYFQPADRESLVTVRGCKTA